jgi:hypothetical protein
MHTKLIPLALVLAIAVAGEARADHEPEPAAVCADAPVPMDPPTIWMPSPRWNISSNPVGWIVGVYGASITAGLAENLAIRADANYFTPIATEAKGFELGAGLPIYVDRTFDGLYFEPGFIVRRYGDDRAEPVYGPQLLAGWHWIWNNRLNVAVAAGVGRDIRGAGDTTHANFFLNGSLRFGYAF